MSGVTGRSMRMAFAKMGTNSWGVAASVTMGLYWESDGGLQLKPAQITDNAFGQTFLGPADPGLVEAPALVGTGRWRYDDYQYVLEALAMGSPTAPVISSSVSGQTTSWRHQFDLADAIDGLAATFAFDKQLYVDELTSAKVHGFELTQADNGAMNMAFNLLGSKPINYSSININSTLGGATYPALGNRVVQQQGVFRLNVASGGSLVAADAIKAESIKFTFLRPQDAPHIYGTDVIDEPADNDFPTVMLEIKAPRFNTLSGNSMYAGLRSSTIFKGDWTFLGPFINSTDRLTALFQMPSLQLLDDGFLAATEGASQVKPVLKFAGRLAAAAPTGMSGITRPFRLTRIMTQSVAAF